MPDERNGRAARPEPRIIEDDRRRPPQRDQDPDTSVEASPGRVQAAPRDDDGRSPLEDDYADPERRREILRRARDL